jgi:AcrR family transcriptional regulator
MMGERRDRRVVRTRQLLQDALVALISERGYADLTIQDVLDRADVGRATFYGHFRGKDALLISHLHRLLAAPLRAHFEVVRGQGRISPRAPIELVVAAIVSARLGALVWWLEAGLPYSPEEMDRLVEQLTTGGAALVLAAEQHGREHSAQRLREQFSLRPATARPSSPPPPR